MERRKKQRISSFLFLVCALTFSCVEENEEFKQQEGNPAIPHYSERGSITVVTDYNSTNYFVYRGEPMGFQYELLNLLAEHLGVELEIIVNNSLEESFDCLLNGPCDLLAKNISITRERRRIVDFTEPHLQTRQVLVQRKPDGWQNMTGQEIDQHLIRNALDLGGKTIYVQRNSAYVSRLSNLMEEIGDTIIINEVDIVTEQLITMVAGGQIAYTVADENIARVNHTYHRDIDIGTAISFTQNQAWAVRKGDVSLRDSIDIWLMDFKSTREYRLLYNKYFRNRRTAQMVQSELYANNSGRLSPYDDLIRKYSEQVDWDWRLLASLIYQESNFRHDVESWAGARGLMQLMPATAEQFGVREISDPEDNIRGGVRYIRWLDQRFRENIPDEDERLKFILASYNAGIGHVLDARALARKYERDPDQWNENVDYFILNKSDPKYYLDPVVRHGYARGYEPYRFVGEILNRYSHYKNIITD